MRPQNNENNLDSDLPRELQSTDRQVRLSASGLLLLSVIATLLMASLWLPILISVKSEQEQRRLEQFAAAATTEAEVVSVTRSRGENGRVRVTYRYVAGGEQYTAQASVRRRDAHRFPVGSRPLVRYVGADPTQSWLDGPRPRSTPTWLVFLIPVALFPVAVLLLLVIRKQARLLQEGRATLARITKSEKRRGEEGPTWRVHYQWTLLSGAKRSGHYSVQRKTPPQPGTTVPILYDRDNPKEHARYPLSLVKVPGAPGRKTARRAGRRTKQAVL